MRNASYFVCKFKIVAILAVVASALLSVIFLTLPSHAAGTLSTAQNKQNLYGMVDCYQSGAMASLVSVGQWSWSGATYLGSSITDIVSPSMNCDETVEAATKGKLPSTDTYESKMELLAKMGYTRQPLFGDRCYDLSFQGGNSAKICARVNTGDNLVSDYITVVDNNGTNIKGTVGRISIGTCFFGGDCELKVSEGESFSNLGKRLEGWLTAYSLTDNAYALNGRPQQRSGEAMVVYELTNPNQAALTALKSVSSYKNLNQLTLTKEEQYAILSDALTNFYGSKRVCPSSRAEAEGYENSSNWAAVTIEGQACFLTVPENPGQGTLTFNLETGVPDGTFSNFYAIVEKFSELDQELDENTLTTREKCKAEFEKVSSSYKKTAEDLFERGHSDMANKYLEAAQAIDKKIEHGIYYKSTSDGVVCTKYTTPDGEEKEVELEKDKLEKDKEDYELPGDYNASEDGGDTSSGADGSDTASCFDNAGALGWILCPVLKFVGSTVDSLYETVMEDWLMVNADSYENGQEVYQGWAPIRNFANLIFVIILLIVILSQVTGFGISNYGIKKILPSLVIVIVLVNISFFLCQLAIDVSNIVGGGIKDILNDIQINVGGQFSWAQVGRNFLGTVMDAVGIAGIGVAGYNFVMSGAILPNLILAALGLIAVLISIVFFFLLLNVRQAGLIILVMLAPIAIICYAFPGTKNVYNRWWRMFTSLLMVYPICGFMMGATQLVGNIMLHTEGAGFFYLLTAMLIQIVPFFLVPSIIRSSMNVMGNIGSRLQQTGRGLGRFARGRVENTGAVKNLQRAAETARADMTARQFQRRLNNLDSSFWSRHPRLARIPGLSNLHRPEAVREQQRRYYARRFAESRALNNKNRLDDERTLYEAQNTDDGALSRQIESMQLKYDQEAVDDLSKSIANGHGTYIDADGHEQKINANSPTKLNDALRDILENLKNDPNNRDLITQAKAVQQLLVAKGNTGRAKVIETLRQHSEKYGRTQALTNMAQTIAQNDKLMAAIKKDSPGSYGFINDAADADATILSGADYDTMGAEKLTRETITEAGDDFWNGVQRAVEQGSFRAGKQKKEDAVKLAQTVTDMLGDSRTAARFKKEYLEKANALRKEAYEIQKEDWLADPANAGKTAADYEKQFGKFEDLSIGEQASEQEVELPNGWHFVPGVGGYYDTWQDANGRVLNDLERKKAEEYAKYNAHVEIRNRQKKK